jgi:hypothetical protein
MSLQMFTSDADGTEGCVCRTDIQIFIIKQLHRGSVGLLVSRLQDRPSQIRRWTKSDKSSVFTEHGVTCGSPQVSVKQGLNQSDSDQSKLTGEAST